MPIKFVGLEKLEKQEVDDLTSLSAKYLEKLDREVKSDEFIMDIKVHSPEGKKRQFSLLGKIIFAGEIMTADATDWDLRRTTHKVFQKMITELKHKFKN